MPNTSLSSEKISVVVEFRTGMLLPIYPCYVIYCNSILEIPMKKTGFPGILS